MKARSKALLEKRKSSYASRKNAERADGSAFWQPLALAASLSDPSQALDRAMEAIGAGFHADRAWVGRYNTAATHFWGVCDWVGPGIASHLHELQGVSADVLGAAHQMFLQGENVAIPDVERLPRQARSLQAELRREGILSTLAAPLAYEGKLIGFYGLDHVRSVADWTPADLAHLPALGKFLSGLLCRRLAAVPPSDLPATGPRSVHVSDPGGLRAVSLEDIVFIKANGDYSHVHAGDGRHYFERRSLRTWIAQLPRERFLRVHQSYLVNGARIARLDRGARWELQLQDIPDPIPVGRAFRHAVRLHMGF